MTPGTKVEVDDWADFVLVVLVDHGNDVREEKVVELDWVCESADAEVELFELEEKVEVKVDGPIDVTTGDASAALDDAEAEDESRVEVTTVPVGVASTASAC